MRPRGAVTEADWRMVRRRVGPRTPGRRILCLALAWLASVGPAAADGIMFVRAGAFWMGTDDGPIVERPRHRVYVRDFWIERHKVTNAEFAAFLSGHGLRGPDGRRRYDADDVDARIHLAPGSAGRWLADPGWEDHPAVEVSWFGARDFCAARGLRLPTEAEWEKAARGEDSRRYPWGAAAPGPARAIFGRAYSATEPTDTRPGSASPYSVEDLLGNLREWTSTILQPYPYRADDGREPFTGDTGRVVVRGASHDDPAEALAVSTRRAYEPGAAAAGHHHVGFRCATTEDLGEIASFGRRRPVGHGEDSGGR